MLSPFKRFFNSCKCLSRICISSDIDPLLINLVWNIKSQYFIEVFVWTIRTKDNFDLNWWVTIYSTFRWNDREHRQSFLIGTSLEFPHQWKLDWKTRDVFNLKLFGWRFPNQEICKIHQPIFRCDLYLRSYSPSFQINRTDSKRRIHFQSLFIYLLRERLELNQHRFSLPRQYSSSSIEHCKTPKRSHGIHLKLFNIRTDVCDEYFHRLSECNWYFSKVERFLIWNQCSLDGSCSDFNMHRFHVFFWEFLNIFEEDW